MDCRQKIIPLADLAAWRQQVRATGSRLVVTNGCFDLLHAGHVNYLEAARNQGDLLLVGVNSDESVRGLKGEGRPLNPEMDRAVVMAALEAVAAVCVFPELRATRFLAVAQPDIYVKGGDYTVASLDAEERQTVVKAGGRIVILPLTPGKSTSSLVNRIAGASAPQ